MNKKLWTALFVILVFIISVISLLLYNLYFLPEVKSIDMYFTVANKMGVNVDDDALYFGKAYPGATTRRELIMQNNYNYPVQLTISSEGSIKPFVRVSTNEIFLEPDETTTVTYFVTTLKDTPLGNYSGVTKVMYRRVLFE